MYIPDCFNDSTVEEVRTLIEENGFGLLINTTQGKLWATHIPMELTVNEKGEEVLLGHIARANKQWKSFEDGKEVLAVFQGPHSYISPKWYTHQNVPTWNYVAAHVYGRIKKLEGEPLYKALTRLLNKYETRNKTYMKLEDLPEKFVKRELRGLVGFEIAITEIQASFKLSQRKDEKSYDHIIQALETSAELREVKIAAYMKKRKKDLFPGKN